MIPSHQGLLLIEDDKPLAKLIGAYLNKHGFTVTHVIKGRKALEQTQDFSLIICDVMLPDINGFDLFHQLSEKWSCPIIYLTALANDKDLIHGLSIGASDYLTKPVNPAVLLAKINANLRKEIRIIKPNSVAINDFIIDSTDQSVKVANQLLPFTSQEFSILWVMANNRGKILNREFMFEKIIGREYDGLDRAVDLQISRLRKKLENLSIPGLAIKTVRGKGYLFNYQPHLIQL